MAYTEVRCYQTCRWDQSHCPTQYLWIVIVGGIVAFATAYGIGANEVANCFGTQEMLSHVQSFYLAVYCTLLGLTTCCRLQ